MKTINDYKQKNSADRALVIACLSAILGLAGCQQEETAEKTAQKIDQATENAEQKINQATENANQNLDAARESLEQKADRAKESIDKSTDASKEELEKAAQKIDRAAEDAKQKIGQAADKAENALEVAKESVIDKTARNGEYIDDSIVITMNVKSAILNDPLLKASQIEVATVNGVVTLSGTVDSEQSIGRALEIANSQKNVKSVETYLIVKTNAPRK